MVRTHTKMSTARIAVACICLVAGDEAVVSDDSPVPVDTANLASALSLLASTSTSAPATTPRATDIVASSDLEDPLADGEAVPGQGEGPPPREDDLSNEGEGAPEDGERPPEGPEAGGGGAGTNTNMDYTERCDQGGLDADYTEFLSNESGAAIRWCTSETGCPNHVNWNLNPNPARVTASNVSIPAYPMLQPAGGTTDLSSTPGAIGTLRNGVSLGSSWARGVADSYEESAFYTEGESLDICGGHATTPGWYHYHSVPGCLQEQAYVAGRVAEHQHSPLLGWAHDGFPIYGQLGFNGVEMKVCGEDGAHSVLCLDLCSGLEGELPGVDDFTYRYYTSCGMDASFFPFTVNCFRGCCPDGLTCGNDNVEACAAGAEAGYTAAYSPTKSSSLATAYATSLIQGIDTNHINTTHSVNCSLFMGSWTASDTPAPSSSASTRPPMTELPTSFGFVDGPTPSPTIPPIFLPTSAPSAFELHEGLTNSPTSAPTSASQQDTWAPTDGLTASPIHSPE